MKWYPINEGELRFLAVADGVTAFLFAMGGSAITFALDLTKDFAITTGVPAQAAEAWGGYRLAAWIIGIISIIGAIGMMIWRGLSVKRLKNETDFD